MYPYGNSGRQKVNEADAAQTWRQASRPVTPAKVRQLLIYRRLPRHRAPDQRQPQSASPPLRQP